ncbi:MAG: hypothetical protein IID41_15290 [Planctomycetes bacterium]|nr:hypothetical protein [Planctomycetota bacterium]
MSGPTIGSIPTTCLSLLEFLEASRPSSKHGLEEKEIPEDLRPDDVVVWCEAQELIHVERQAPSMKGPARSIYQLTGHGIATLAGQRLRVDENDGGEFDSDRKIRAQSNLLENSNQNEPTPPMATAAEAVAYVGDEWATIRQLSDVTGRTQAAIRSAFSRAKNARKFHFQDEQQVPDAGPGQARTRFRIKGVWRFISPTSSARPKTP